MLKGGIKTAHNKSLKRSYKNLDQKQYRVIKVIEAKEQADKFLYGRFGFFATAPRLENKSIDWDRVDPNILIAVENSNKAIEKFNKLDDSLVAETLKKFRQGQFSYSQSF